MRTPNASSTSALPTLPEIARLPCFATRAPAPANTSAATVEMLNVPASSPPVPTMSITPGPASTVTMCSRMARANPASSDAVSPFTRSATKNAPTAASCMPPSSSSVMASWASAEVRSAPAATR